MLVEKTVISLVNFDPEYKPICYSNGQKEIGCQMVRYLNAIRIPDSPVRSL